MQTHLTYFETVWVSKMFKFFVFIFLVGKLPTTLKCLSAICCVSFEKK